MGNNYGITSLESTPSQDTVDGFLNWCDANPPNINLDGITKEAAEELKEQLNEISASVEKKMNDMVNPPMEYLRDQLSCIAPILNAPAADPGAIVEWINNLIALITKPYQPIIEAVAWWPKFSAAAASAVSGTVSRCTEQIEKVNQALVGIA